MLRTLIRYECKKSVGNRFFLIVFCLFLLVQMIWIGGLQEWLEYQDYLEQLSLHGMEPAKKMTVVELLTESRKVTAQIRKEHGIIGQLSPEEQSMFVSAMEQKYGENVFDPMEMVTTEEMFAPSGYFSGFQDYVMINTYNQLHGWNQAIDSVRQQVVDTASALAEQAAADGDNYALRRNQNIIRLYREPLSNITSGVYGWNTYLADNNISFLAAFLVLLACSGSVSAEHDHRTWMLLHTAKNGKRKTLAAKYLSGALIAIVIVLLLHLASLCAVLYRSGFLGAGQPVQALEQLSLCPYSLTVWQFALLRLMCQMAGAALLSLLLTTISAFSKSGILSYGAGTILLGGFLLLEFFLPHNGWLVSPMTLCYPHKYFDSYYTANLLEYPVPWVIVHTVLWISIAWVLSYLADLIYHRKRESL
jgi:ABC-type transport system involved in multi-copper enzyme maturation permease subunit